MPTYGAYVHLLDTWSIFPFLPASLLLPYPVFNRGNETFSSSLPSFSLFLLLPLPLPPPSHSAFFSYSTETSSRILSKLSTMDFVPVARFLFRMVPRSNRFYLQWLTEKSDRILAMQISHLFINICLSRFCSRNASISIW